MRWLIGLGAAAIILVAAGGALAWGGAGANGSAQKKFWVIRFTDGQTTGEYVAGSKSEADIMANRIVQKDRRSRKILSITESYIEDGADRLRLSRLELGL